MTTTLVLRYNIKNDELVMAALRQFIASLEATTLVQKITHEDVTTTA